MFPSISVGDQDNQGGPEDGDHTRGRPIKDTYALPAAFS